MAFCSGSCGAYPQVTFMAGGPPKTPRGHDPRPVRLPSRCPTNLPAPVPCPLGGPLAHGRGRLQFSVALLGAYQARPALGEQGPGHAVLAVFTVRKRRWRGAGEMRRPPKAGHREGGCALGCPGLVFLKPLPAPRTREPRAGPLGAAGALRPGPAAPQDPGRPPGPWPPPGPWLPPGAAPNARFAASDRGAGGGGCRVPPGRSLRTSAGVWPLF